MTAERGQSEAFKGAADARAVARQWGGGEVDPVEPNSSQTVESATDDPGNLIDGLGQGSDKTGPGVLEA